MAPTEDDMDVDTEGGCCSSAECGSNASHCGHAKPQQTSLEQAFSGHATAARAGFGSQTSGFSSGFSGGSDGGGLQDLINTLKHADPRKRWKAAEAIGRQGPAAIPALSALVIALSDMDNDVRTSAARALGHLGNEAAPVVPTLQKMLASERDGGVRWGAAEALSNLAKVAQPAMTDLMKALSDEEEDVREAAAVALGRMAMLGYMEHGLGEVLAEKLIPLLKDEEWQVCRAAAEALGRCGASAVGAVPELELTRSHGHPRVSKAAFTALEKIRPEPGGGGGYAPTRAVAGQ